MFLPHLTSQQLLSRQLRADVFPDSNYSRRDGGWHSSDSDPQVHITFDFIDGMGKKVNGTQHSYMWSAQEYNDKYGELQTPLLSKLPIVPPGHLGSSQPPGGSQGFATVATWFPRPALDIRLEMFDDMNPAFLGTPIEAY